MKQMQAVFDRAERLFDMPDLIAALDRLAATLNADYANLNPIVLCVMKGSVVPTGQLLPRLAFPLELDYLHATRYGQATQGAQLDWKVSPGHILRDRHVLLIEDIYDEGITLAALRASCQQAGASSVKAVAMVAKQQAHAVEPRPEYVGLVVPNRYVFGFGMDYRGYWRNAPGIYAVAEQDL